MSDDLPQKDLRQHEAARLKARAVRFLSRREHSRAELTRKLLSHAPDEAMLEQVLDELESAGWQSDDRYAGAVVRSSAERFGMRRVAQKLREGGVDSELAQEALEKLRESEPTRALAVWEKRFGRTGLPSEPREYARQARFLAARGFSADIVRKILSGQMAEQAEDLENRPFDPDHDWT